MSKRFLTIIGGFEDGRNKDVIINFSSIEIVKITTFHDLFEIKTITPNNTFEYQYNSNELDVFNLSVKEITRSITPNDSIRFKKVFDMDDDIKTIEWIIFKNHLSSISYYPETSYMTIFTNSGKEVSFIYSGNLEEFVNQEL